MEKIQIDKHHCTNCKHFGVGSSDFYCNLYKNTCPLKENYDGILFHFDPENTFLKTLKKIGCKFSCSFLIDCKSLNDAGSCNYYVKKWYKFWTK